MIQSAAVAVINVLARDRPTSLVGNVAECVELALRILFSGRGTTVERCAFRGCGHAFGTRAGGEIKAFGGLLRRDVPAAALIDRLHPL